MARTEALVAKPERRREKAEAVEYVEESMSGAEDKTASLTTHVC